MKRRSRKGYDGPPEATWVARHQYPLVMLGRSATHDAHRSNPPKRLMLSCGCARHRNCIVGAIACGLPQAQIWCRPVCLKIRMWRGTTSLHSISSTRQIYARRSCAGAVMGRWEDEGAWPGSLRQMLYYMIPKHKAEMEAGFDPSECYQTYTGYGWQYGKSRMHSGSGRSAFTTAGMRAQLHERRAPERA